MGEDVSARQWYVLRDLKRANAKQPAYRMLTEAGFEVFTPVTTVVERRGAETFRRERPVISDLLFVHATDADLRPAVVRTPTLQFRYVKGAPFGTPMTVNEPEMNRFIAAVNASQKVRYYAPDEILPSMVGRQASIVGGPLDGQQGNIISVRGSRKRRLLLQLPGIIAAAVEVEPEYIRMTE